MLLKPDERDFKTRVWNNLNKDWIIDQKERKRKKKLLQKKQKYQTLTNSSQISQSAAANSAGVMTPDNTTQLNFVLNQALLEKKLLDNSNYDVNSGSETPLQTNLFIQPKQLTKSPIQLPQKRKHIKAESAADALKQRFPEINTKVLDELFKTDL